MSEEHQIQSGSEEPKNILLNKNLTLLAIFGLWPFQGRKFLENKCLRTIHYTYGIVLYFFFFIFLITEYMELANVWGDLENMTTNMSVSCLYTVGVMKIYAFFGHRDKFKKLIGGISNMEKFIVVSEDEDIKTAFRAYVQRAQFVTNFFCSLTIGTIIVFFAVPPVEYTFSSVYHRVYDNGTEFWSYERPMIFSSWFPFDKYAKTNYLIAYLYHVLMGIIGSAYQAIWDTFIVTMMLHSIGQLQILQINVKNMTSFHEKNKIKKFSDDASLNQILEDRYKDKKMYERLVNCVYHHRYISNFTHELNTIIAPVMMLYFMVCSLMLCAIGFQASLYGFSIRLCFMIEYLIAMMIQLFLFYWHANELIVENNKLFLVTYSCEWYLGSEKFKKNLYIMRQGFQLPLQYTVGQFYAMSLPTFLGILRASYSYFALLRQVQEEN